MKANMFKHLMSRVLLVIGSTVFVTVGAPVLLTSQTAMFAISAVCFAIACGLFGTLYFSMEDAVNNA